MKSISTRSGIIIIIPTVILSILSTVYFTATYVLYPLTNTETIIVIKPIFTASAYQQNGFYDYYKQKCGKECLTVKISDTLSYDSSKNAINVFEWNKLKIITDIDLHLYPEILSQYKTVILLHNEYVTQEEFDSITSHPNVIYLYPNALYGKVKFDSDKITLERGHNYPEITIKNGFDWKFDNSEMEYDTKCREWEFYKVDNGHMLNCYPEHVIYSDVELLKKIEFLTN